MATKNNVYVWYVGYGSNLLRERFSHYISGGRFRWGGSLSTGCNDKTLPTEDRPITIPYGLFFAKRSSSWGNGGVAFILPKQDEHNLTYGRMWKITEEQFLEIWKQEGRSWYDKQVFLGEDEKGVPIWTITSSSDMPFTRPSDNYLKTIIAGLKETYHLSNELVLKYLMKTPGIEGNFKEQNLITICQSI